MTEPTPRVDINLSDLKARKGHLCQGGLWGDGENPSCGCGARLRELPDFMDLPPDQQRGFSVPVEAMYDLADAMPVVQVDRGGIEYAPVVRGDEDPPAPFHHANGEPCYGCQSCFADMIDPNSPEMDAAIAAYAQEYPEPEHSIADTYVGNPMTEADAVESTGRDIIVRHDAPDMTPSVPLVDPTMPYGPAEVERAILDANNRLERGSKHEANLIAATEQLKIEYELRYARAIEESTGGAADIRKANAVLASEREYRAWHEAKAACDAMKAVTHSLRSTVSALQSVGRSVGVSYQGPQGRGR